MIKADRPQLMIDRHKLVACWSAGDDFSKDWRTRAPMRSVNRYLATNSAYRLAIPDVVRARVFEQTLRRWLSEGKMPNLVIMQLPSARSWTC